MGASIFLQHDEKLVSSFTQKKPTVQTLNLIEDLGNITHIFSDKTGTMTLNQMQFKSIGISNCTSVMCSSMASVFVADQNQLNSEIIATRSKPNKFVDFDSWEFLTCIKNMTPQERHYMKELLFILCICHSTIPKSSNKVPSQPCETVDESASEKFNTSQMSSIVHLKACDSSANILIKSTPCINNPIISCSVSAHDNTSTNKNPEFPVLNKSVNTTRIKDASNIVNGQFKEDTISTQEGIQREPLPEKVIEEKKFLKASSLSAPIADMIDQTQKRTLGASTFLKLKSSLHSGKFMKETEILYNKRELRKGIKLNPSCTGLWWFDPQFSTKYDASSPDELALVYGAKHNGFEFVQRPNLNTILIALTTSIARELTLSKDQKVYAEQNLKKLGKKNFADYYPSYDPEFNWLEYFNEHRTTFSKIPGYVPYLSFEILEVLEFDSSRKKMSVIVRDGYDCIKLYTKGADSAMLKVAQKQSLVIIQNQVLELSLQGLRTLVFGYREITEQEFNQFRDKLTEVRSFENEEEVSKVYDEFESNLIIVGCTGVEDKLQPNVAETIQQLRMANIKLWILTGDKPETAMAVAQSCNVLTESTYNAIIKSSTELELREQLHNLMSFIIAGQLTNDAINEFMLLKTSKSHNSTKFESKVYGCYPCSKNFRHYTKNDLKNSPEPTNLKINLFRRIILNKFRSKPVISQPIQKVAEPLSLSQAESLLNVYCNNSNLLMENSTSSQLAPSLLKYGELTSIKTFKEKLSVQRSEHTPEKFEAQISDVQRYNDVAITITGEALAIVLENETIKQFFFGVANFASTVIACRVSPKQKAELVMEYKKSRDNVVTLAIGDGANDCGMIVAADVGIGVEGREGTQAVRAADFAVGEFCLLKPLLFHHGHECLRRNSVHVYHTIFKNVLFGSVDWIFGLFNKFSANDVFHPWLKQVYNSLFNSLPPIVYSIFDKMVPSYILVNSPSLYPSALNPQKITVPYILNSENYYFGSSKFICCYLYGFIGAVAIVFIVIFSTANLAVVPNSDYSFDINLFGQIIFYSNVLVRIVLTKPPCFKHYSYTVHLYMVLVFTSIVCILLPCLFLAWTVCSFWIDKTDLFYTLTIFDNSHFLHLLVAFATLVSLLPVTCYQCYRVVFSPGFIRVIRERIALGVFDLFVAPQKVGGLAVVVPRTNSKENLHGFAFSESRPRIQLERKEASIPKAVYIHTTKLRHVAEEVLQGNIQ